MLKIFSFILLGQKTFTNNKEETGVINW